MKHGVIISKEEDMMRSWWTALLAGISRVKLAMGFSDPMEDLVDDEDTEGSAFNYSENRF